MTIKAFTPQQITDAGDSVYFSSFVPEVGFELWRTRGTDALTTRITEDIPAFSGPIQLTPVQDGKVFFLVPVVEEERVVANQLWVTDGTRAGTKHVVDAPIAFDGTDDVGVMLGFMQNLLFVGNNSQAGAELWKSDGTREGTEIIFDASKGENSAPQQIIAVDGATYFATHDAVTGRPRFWKSTSESTELLLELPEPSLVWHPDIATAGRITEVISIKDQVYFVRAFDGGGSAGDLSAELFTSDGTSAGTSLLVADFDHHIASDDQYATVYFADSASELVFEKSAWEPLGSEKFGLAITDGDIVSFLKEDIHVRTMVSVGDTVFFSADDGEHGQELWKTDGISDVQLVKDIRAGAASGLYDPTPEQRISVSLTKPPIGVFAHEESQMIAFNDLLVFTADDGATGIELWKSDGSEEGTELIRDILPGEEGSDPDNFAIVGNQLFFTVRTSSGFDIWKTDGSRTGTSLVQSGFLGIQRPGSEVAVLGADGFYFFSAETDTGWELWRSDGTDEGTFQLKDILPGKFGSNPDWLVETDDGVYFVARDPLHGREIWRTDGTVDGTELAFDIWLGPESSNPTGLVSRGVDVVFAADDGIRGRELWEADEKPPLIGDANRNGKVDFPDFLILASYFGQTTQQGRFAGDFNDDGLVNFADFLQLSLGFLDTAEEE